MGSLDEGVAKRVEHAWPRAETILRVHILADAGEPPFCEPIPQAGRSRTRQRAGPSRRNPAQCCRHFGVLRGGVLAYAVECDYIARTPCRGIKLPEVPLPRSSAAHAEPGGCTRRRMGPDLVTMVYLGAVLGLRWGECAGLRVGDSISTATTRGRRATHRGNMASISSGNRRATPAVGRSRCPLRLVDTLADCSIPG